MEREDFRSGHVPLLLSGGLEPLIREVNALGLKFGLWMEPEMVSEDSELYRSHPAWALTMPGRKSVMGREQMVLDLSRQDVSNWLYETISGLLISASPNHQAGRSTPLGTRAVVAMSGTFGIELDPAALEEEEKAEVRQWVERFRAYDDLVRNGRYYRLTAPGGNDGFTAWQFVSEDRRRTMISVVVTETASNPKPIHIRPKGLAPEGKYIIMDMDVFGSRETGETSGRTVFSGAALMHGGYTLPSVLGDYPSAQLVFEQRREEKR